jgi:NADPH:quinone reductase
MLQRVTRSTVIDAPIERVWAILRDFNSHDQWHDVVETSRIEGGERSDQVGCIRDFTLKDGNRVREQLLTLSDTEFKSTYCIVEATIPLQRYVASVTLKRVTDGNRTFWNWESSFATPPGRERELRDLVAQGVYEAGFENLRRHLRHGPSRDPRRVATASAARSPRPARSGGLPMPSRQMAQRRYGEAEVLEPHTGEAPAPGPGEVRIEQRAIGVNFIDIYLRRGDIPPMLPLNSASGAPAVLGMEAAGTVLDVGEGVSGVLPGDRVAYMYGAPGAYCSVRTVPADRVLRLPPHVEDATAAATLLKGVTADYLLRDLGHVKRCTKLLVHAAAGGVGLLLCAWARALGATVIGTTSTEEKARIAREHGCEHVIVTSDYRFADAVQHLCGGAEVIVDGLGEAAREQNMQALALCGHWISLGQASGGLSPIDANWLLHKSITFSRPVAFHYVATHAALLDRAGRVWDALAAGTLRAPPIERFTLGAAAQAHARIEARATTGAVVLIA